MSALCKVFMIIYHRFWGFFFLLVSFFQTDPASCYLSASALILSLHPWRSPDTATSTRRVCLQVSTCRFLFPPRPTVRQLLMTWEDTTIILLLPPPPFVFKAVCVLLRVRVQFVWVCAVLCCDAVMFSGGKQWLREQMTSGGPAALCEQQQMFIIIHHTWPECFWASFEGTRCSFSSNRTYVSTYFLCSLTTHARDTL